MKKILLVVLLLMAAVAGSGWLAYRWLLPPATAAALDPDTARVAEALLDHLDAGRFDAALAMFDPEASAALAGGKLQQVWQTLGAQLGPRTSRSPLRGESVSGVPVATSTLVFAQVSLDARVSVDAQGRVSGFRLVPASTPAAVPVALESNARFVESAFAVGEGERALPGTLTRPPGAARVPAVVLVHGSGPNDRDETIGPNKPFRDLAHGLAERGIAVLRFDKRTKARPQDFASGDFTVIDETVDDAVGAVRQLRSTDGIDPARVYVVGHSLGAWMAPRIAQRLGDDVAGAILLAAPSRPLQTLYLEQIEYLANADGSIDASERAKIVEERVKADAIATLTPATPSTQTLLGLPASYWIDLRDYDAVALTASLKTPMLVLQGGRDYQVTPAGDFARWQQAFDGSPRVHLRMFPALNHLFIAGSGAPNAQEYLIDGHVDPAVVDAIANWIGRDTATGDASPQRTLD